MISSFSTVNSFICSAIFSRTQFSFRASSLVNKEANDSTNKSAVSLGQVVVCPLAFGKQDTVLFDFFLFLRYAISLLGFCFTFLASFFFIIFSKFPFYNFIFFFSFKGRREIEMLKVCHALFFSFRARRSFEPSHRTLRIVLVIPIFHFLCKILQSSKFIAKSKRPQKQTTKFCIGSAKKKTKTKHPRLSVLSFLTAKSGQSDHDEVRSDFEVSVDSF